MSEVTYDDTVAVPAEVHEAARADHSLLLTHLDEVARLLTAEGYKYSAAVVRSAIDVLR